jgi:hypothetical protein
MVYDSGKPYHWTDIYEGNLDAQQFVNEIHNLVPPEERFGYFIKDGATPHTAKETIRALRGVFRELMGRIKLLARVSGSLDPPI